MDHAVTLRGYPLVYHEGEYPPGAHDLIETCWHIVTADFFNFVVALSGCFR